MPPPDFQNLGGSDISWQSRKILRPKNNLRKILPFMQYLPNLLFPRVAQGGPAGVHHL